MESTCYLETSSSYTTLTQRHIHKERRHQAVPILSHINPMHVIPSCFFKVHFGVILPSVPRFAQLVSSAVVAGALTSNDVTV